MKVVLRVAAVGVLMMGILGVMSVSGVSVTTTPRADALVPGNRGWPASWRNPATGTDGGTIGINTNFGACSLGCSNADTSHDYTYYLGSGWSDPPTSPSTST